jgi:predicted LPLAT superfamily acyltransferase
MTSWKGKTRGGVAGYRFFIFLLKYPGLKFSYFFLRFVVLYFVLFVPDARNPIYHYFRHILRFSKLKSVKYVFRNFYLLGQTLLDKVALMAGFHSKFTIDHIGGENLSAMAADKGGMIIGAHIGNWEIAGQLLERINAKVYIVMLEAEHEKIKAMLDDVMTKKSMNIIPIKDDLSHIIAIKNALADKSIIAIHGDRFVQGSKTMTGKLLGMDAEFPFGPFYLAAKFNAAVSFVGAVKETDTHYRFHCTKPKTYSTTGGRKEIDKTVKNILDDYLKDVEQELLDHPEQWFNYYYFWSPPK